MEADSSLTSSVAGINVAKVLMTDGQLRQGKKMVEKYAKLRLENGYSLIGVIYDNKVCEIKKIVPAGRNSKRSPVSFSPDVETVKKALQKEMSVDPRSRYFGECHSHPWDAEPYPSPIDVNQTIEARETRPWTMMGIHSTKDLKFFGLDKNGEPIEIPLQVVPDRFSEQGRIARISEITDGNTFAEKKVAMIGAGSLASAAIQSLAATQIRKLLVADMDDFSIQNTIRHIGGVCDVGKDKTELLKQYIESKNPMAHVKTVKDDLLKNRDLLKGIVNWADLIVAASGNPALNYQINIQCVKNRKPCVFGGIYDRAEKGYASYYDPSDGKACFECLFGITASAIDNGTITRQYGLEEGELNEAQGLYADILPVGCIMGKMALWLLSGQKRGFNLAIYHNDFKVERFNVPKKSGCPTCDYNFDGPVELQKPANTSKAFEAMKKIWRRISDGRCI